MIWKMTTEGGLVAVEIKDWLGEDNKLGIDIWNKKYRRNNESFNEWLDRVSGGDEYVRQLILEKKFLFGGRILSNRGIEDEGVTYSNCYVIAPPEDNIESIYDTCKYLARTYSYGGGCGIDISKLAPEGAKVKNQAKTTSGAVSFMDTFAQVTEQIGQNGRRGALMISLDCKHPDLEKFITVKSDLDKVTSANISVRVSDDFMEDVIWDNQWELKFTRPETGEIISKIVRANDIFHLICENNWNYAEPGILFWNRIKKWNLLCNNPEFEYAGVNPCAEEPLPAGGSCLLGSLNLAAFVHHNRFDFKGFDKAVKVAVKALNDVLDEGLEKHPLQEQRDSVRNWRQIGLGVMGIADMLIKLGYKYGCSDSITICDEIGKHLIQNALLASSELAKEYGAYPKYKRNVLYNIFFESNCINNDKVVEHVKRYGLRNSQLLTIAPTGTISTMLGISSGIEPIFANSYNRLTKSLHGEDVSYKVYTPIVAEYMKKYGITDEKNLPDFFVTAHDIDVEDRLLMQSTWQSHIDASISSTINLPEETTVDDIEELFIRAWEMGLKGVTVYRENCARLGILTTDQGKSTKEDKKPSYNPILSVKNDSDTIGLERHLMTGCGTLHVCAYFDGNGNLRNTYLSKGSTGGCNNFMIGLSRMISLAARNGLGIHEIVDQLNSCGSCPSYAVRRATKHDVSEGSCCPVAVGKALMEMWGEINERINKGDSGSFSVSGSNEHSVGSIQHNTDNQRNEEITTDTCPECGGEILHVSGCVQCNNCGWSRCS